MRIIGGRFRGKELKPLDGETRPTTDRVRENIFNILGMRVVGARVLDLFSGSGAMGLEAISRGAKEVIFNDTSKAAVDVIKKNGGSEIYNLDYMGLLEKLRNQKFDIVFLDPPYESDFGVRAIEFLIQNKMAKLTVFESDRNHDFDGLNLRVKKYGKAVVHFLFAE